MPAWLVFISSAVVVVIAGVRLARDGDTIARRTRLGGAWVGAILVAGTTSLPELATDITAVRQGETNLAIGDLFGSSMANMLLLAVADLVTRQVRLLTQVAINQAIVGVLAISLTSIAIIGVLMDDAPTLFGVGWAPLAIGLGYVLGMRLLHQNRGEQPPTFGARQDERKVPSLRGAVVGFVVSAVVVLAAAPYLVRSGAALAEQWGISTGFFGVVFLAATTSLPETAVMFAAVRAGAYALAVGNLLGSNCFNMVILLVLDIVDGPGSILAQAEPGIVVAAVFAMLLMGQVLLDLLNRAEHRIWYLEPGPALVVLTYVAGLLLTYQAGH